MSIVVVTGAQWGDEGKGKVVDGLARDLEPGDVCVRFQGGANAGHTIYVGSRKLVSHIVPSAVMHSGVLNLVGPAVACDLGVIAEELTIAQEFGSEVLIDRSAPIVLPFHKTLDQAREGFSGSKAIGTTGRGIGPVFSDLTARYAVRMGDLTNPDRVRNSLLERNFYRERRVVLDSYGVKIPTLEETVEWCMSFASIMCPLLADTRAIVGSANKRGKNILFEGAQGVMLDVLHGSQPDTTSSLCTAAAVAASFGVYNPDRVVGVTKAYATRVGNGPFPTEQDNKTGEQLRQKGGEFGATTGRPRRCGWLDLVALRYACRLGGITELAVVKADVLEGFDEVLVGTGYFFEGQPFDPFGTLTSRVLREAKVEYTTFQGWPMGSVVGCREFLSLPLEVRRFFHFISSFLDVPIKIIGTGKERDDVIIVK